MLPQLRRGLLPARFTEQAAFLIARTGLSPNALTIMGFVVNVGVAAVLATGNLFVGGLLILFSGVFDLLDGAVARATKQSTRFGAILDSTLDRFSEAVILFGLLVLFTGQQATQEILLIYATIVGSVLVSYVRARAEGLGLKCEVGLFSRTERVILLALGLLLNQTLIVLWVLAVFTNMTAAQRVLYVWQQVGRPPRSTSGQE